MAIVNQSKPSTSLTNTTRALSYETWDSNTTTWATETRTWDDMASEMDNQSKPTFGYLWGSNSLPWLEDSPWDDTFSGIINQSKP